MHDFKKIPEWPVAIEAIQKAAQLTESVRHSFDSATLDKNDKSPVTIADFGAQALVLKTMMHAFPGDLCVAEEDSGELTKADNSETLKKLTAAVRGVDSSFSTDTILSAIDLGNDTGGSKGRVWTLDPIDGTKGFLRNDQYAIALGLMEAGKLIFGVLACPNLPMDFKDPTAPTGSLFWAIRGGGAFTAPIDDPDQFRPIRVKDTSEPSHASFCESVESGHSSHGTSARIAEILGVTAPPVRIDSQCKYAAVARGDAAIYLRLPTKKGYEEKIWDHAAGALIVEEAGGTVTDIEGKALDFSLGRTLKENRGIVASNATFHDRIIDAIKNVLR
jgi:HAL2 family 3'(2'),5'-bisphosphate nucleotidase